MSTRTQQLQKNFSNLFWTKAFLNLKMYNIVASLFFIQRGLTVREIFYLSIIWSVTSLISEVPSSYLADKWGRKKTILLGVVFAFIHWAIVFFAQDFLLFAISFFFFSLSFAMISGTDEALLYDTHKELGDDKSALGRLGRFMSAERFFKTITVLIAAILAKDLAPWQFSLLIGIDLLATVVALFFALRLVEPYHQMDVEQMQRGALQDVYTLMHESPLLRRAMMGKTLFFISSFILWRFQDVFFIGLGIPIVWFAVAWATYQGLVFLSTFNIKHILPNKTLNDRINRFNHLSSFFLLCFLVMWNTFPYPYLLLFFYIGFELFNSIAQPWYSKLFHAHSASYNRATTISMINFIKGVLEIPLLFCAALLVGINVIYPYYFTFAIVVFTLIFFSLPKWREVH